MKVTVEVNFLSPKKMQELNKKWRGKSYVPAVLSFPYFDKVGPELAKEDSRQSRGSYYEPTEEGMLLGEVLICKQEARKLAKKNKVTEEEQINDLIVHGIKHILGVNQD